MSGLAEYISLIPCPYPPIVAEWGSIDEQLVSTFTPAGFTQRDCFRGMGDVVGGWNFSTPQMIASGGRGLGDITLTAPDGYFSTLDFSQWGIAEWGSVLAGLYFVTSLISDTKRGYKKVKARARRSASRSQAIAQAKQSRGLF
jgi:hypothetical protein